MPALKLVPTPAQDVSDRALVDAARHGDRAAAAELYRRHAPRVRRTIARIVGAGAELDDVVQLTFLAALRRLSSLREADAVGAWLIAVGIGEARHHLRAKARRSWLSFRAPDALPDVAAPAAEGTTDAARATAAIVRVLPVDDRIAFSLRYLEGMALVEVANACAVSLATCKRRIARAELRFKELARAYPALDAFVGGRP